MTVSGIDYMEAMIPHHSIAILTSERAGIEDPRVRKLADEIIEAQRKEIAEMKYLIRALARDGVQAARNQAPTAEEMPAAEAVRAADLAKTDLEPSRTRSGSGCSAPSRSANSPMRQTMRRSPWRLLPVRATAVGSSSCTVAWSR